MASPSNSDHGKKSPPSTEDRESSQDSSMDVKIKDEPADAGYEQEQPISSENHSSSNSRASSPPASVVRETDSPSQDPDDTNSSQTESRQARHKESGTNSSIRSQIQSSNTGKKVDTVQNIVEGLLKKNATLLAMNDAEVLRPNSRRNKMPENNSRKGDLGQSTVFPISPVSQARLVPSSGNSDKRKMDMNKTRLLRPKSPTRKCESILRDETQLSYALMEANVGDQEIENIFRVQRHELVCAVSLKSYVGDKDKVVAVLDKSYYWCNFCSFSSTSKDLLTQHIMDHRFCCNFCPYESFCRSDILRHMVVAHSEFSASDTLNYCTFLSDYLRVKSRVEKIENNLPCVDPDNDVKDLDKGEMEATLIRNEKRKKEDEDVIHRSSQKKARLDAEASETNMTDRQGKSRKSLNPRRHPQPSENDFDTFEMEVEEINDYVENGSNDYNSDKIMYPSHASDESSPSVVSRMQIIPSLQEEGKQGFTTTTHVSSPAQSRSGPGRPPKTPCPFNKTKRTSGSTSLYWSCGYCDFQSGSQAEIKEHSNRTHPGKPHRYVALIKNMNPDSIINKNVGKNTNTSNYRYSAQSNESTSESRNSSSTKLNDHAGDKQDRMGNHDDVVSLKDSDSSNLLKVKLNPVRSYRKETTVYRCYHCPYTARRHSAMKSHIYYKHRGKGLLAVDDDSSTGEHVFFCARDDCTFKSVSAVAYLNHVDQCTPWHKPELADVEVEPHIRECLQQTITFAQLSKDKVQA